MAEVSVELGDSRSGNAPFCFWEIVPDLVFSNGKLPLWVFRAPLQSISGNLRGFRSVVCQGAQVASLPDPAFLLHARCVESDRYAEIWKAS